MDVCEQCKREIDCWCEQCHHCGDLVGEETE